MALMATNDKPKGAIMINVETSSLTDTALDYAVALSDHRLVRCDPMGFISGTESGYWVWEDDDPTKKTVYQKIGREYSPSTKWDQGGVILERLRKMSLHQFWIESDGPNVHIMAWLDKHTCIKGYGPTLLIAAMRCYVAACKGESIELPVSLAP